MGKLKTKHTRSQNDKLLTYLKEHKEGITTFQAVEILRIYRISARVADLRGRGYKISTILHKDEETGKRWGQYILVA